MLNKSTVNSGSGQFILPHIVDISCHFYNNFTMEKAYKCIKQHWQENIHDLLDVICA